MASAVVNFPAIIMSSSKYRSHQKLLQVRAQGYEDEGKSRHVVDANLQVLRGRIEEVKIKERLERCLTCEQGWNYTVTTTTTTASLYNGKIKCNKELDYISQCVQLFWMVGWTAGFTIFGCTFCIYLYFPTYSFKSLHIILMRFICVNYVLVKLEFTFPLPLLYPLWLGHLNPFIDVSITILSYSST
uniref:Uncharacterized protein n=1 Tax=Nicotiana tabacum TaxID=4097 RepID=A0A1S4BNS2_TOBAC|nr:uncharacterized protein LOC104107787 isoform X1 [Nicotiana tomentosiformis]XP_016490504.1 PREDICTED: uncharacterized protein LOC107810264 [Nicotiana tabacum]